MDANKVDMYLMSNAKLFDNHLIPQIRERLLSLDDSKWVILQSVELKDPTTMIIVSLLGGSLGIDRFMLGETGLGVVKLLTCGGLGIWTIIDWCMIMGKTRELNFSKLQAAIF